MSNYLLAFNVFREYGYSRYESFRLALTYTRKLGF